MEDMILYEKVENLIENAKIWKSAPYEDCVFMRVELPNGYVFTDGNTGHYNKEDLFDGCLNEITDKIYEYEKYHMLQSKYEEKYEKEENKKVNKNDDKKNILSDELISDIIKDYRYFDLKSPIGTQDTIIKDLTIKYNRLLNDGCYCETEDRTTVRLSEELLKQIINDLENYDSNSGVKKEDLIKHLTEKYNVNYFVLVNTLYYKLEDKIADELVRDMTDWLYEIFKM